MKNPDRDLLELCARAAELEAAIDDRYARSGDEDPEVDKLDEQLKLLHNAIIEMPARTLRGIMAKARRAFWCRGGVEHLTGDTLEERFDSAVIADLMAMD
jgi:hypothetical protein